MENNSGSQRHYERELEERSLLHRADLPLTPVRCGKRWLGLLTREAFDSLPDGTVVESMHGVRRTKGIDHIDLDARGGQISHGIPIEGEDAETLSRIYGYPGDR